MICMIKVPVMIQQIQQSVKSRIPTKITIENFQKWQGRIFTSETTEIELNNTVSTKYSITKNILSHKYITFSYGIIYSTINI